MKDYWIIWKGHRLRKTSHHIYSFIRFKFARRIQLFLVLVVFRNRTAPCSYLQLGECVTTNDVEGWLHVNFQITFVHTFSSLTFGGSRSLGLDDFLVKILPGGLYCGLAWGEMCFPGGFFLT